MTSEEFLNNFGVLAGAPGGIPKLREMILNLAFQGRLVAPASSDGSAKTLLDQLTQATDQPKAGNFSRSDIGSAYIRASPKHWCWVKLGQIAEVTGGITKGRNLAGRHVTSYPYLRVANVQRGFLDLDVMKEIEVPVDELDKYRLRQNDILFTEGGDWDKLGRSAIWEEQLPVCLHQNHVFKARLLSSDLLPRWVSLFANSPIGRSYFSDASKQTTNLASINITQLRNLPTPVPPIPEQTRILAKIDQLLALCAELEVRQTKKQETSTHLTKSALKALTNAVEPEEFAMAWRRVDNNFESLFTTPESITTLRSAILELAAKGQLTAQQSTDEPAPILVRRILEEHPNPPSGELLHPAAPPFAIPEPWTWATGAVAFTFITSGSRGWAQYYSDRGPIFLRIGNLDYGTTVLDLSSIQHVSPPNDAEGTRTRVQPRDILISITGDTGMIGLVPSGLGEAYINQHIALARPSPHINPSYIAHVLMAPFSLGRFQKAQRGIKNSLGLNDIRGLLIPIPPLAEQNRIVAKINSLMALCDELESNLRSAEQSAHRAAEAMTAEITI